MKNIRSSRNSRSSRKAGNLRNLRNRNISGNIIENSKIEEILEIIE
jgi:hypothetical protein